MDWPTTTIQATLVDATLKPGRRNHLSSVIGHYTYEFGAAQHSADIYEPVTGGDEERVRVAEELKESDRVVDLEVQYNPNGSLVVSDEVVTYVTTCRWWIGGFFMFFVLLWLLVLRGFSRLRFR